MNSVPVLEDLINPSAIIVDVDGIKIGITGISMDFSKFLLEKSKNYKFK